MPIGGWLVIYALAVARVTSLITLDEITHTARRRIVRSLPLRPWATWPEYLITCPWCASIWIGAFAAPFVYWHVGSPWLQLPALALAFSQVAGMTSRLGRADDGEV